MLTNFYLLTKVPNKTSGLMLGLEQLLVQMVVLLEVFLEIIAIFIIASAVVMALRPITLLPEPRKTFSTLGLDSAQICSFSRSISGVFVSCGHRGHSCFSQLGCHW